MGLISELYNRYNLLSFERQLTEMELYRGSVSAFSDEGLKAEFLRLKEDRGIEYNLLPKVYCIVEECFRRCAGIEVYREQLLGAIAMHEGFTAEMKTGEGKTVAACFTAVLNSIYGKVYIVTINDYISQRDCENMKSVYNMLGITCSANYSMHRDKKWIYSADIVYTSSSELAFDYLINEFMDSSRKIDIPLSFAILDEIDFILLDNATSYFTVSGGSRHAYPDNSYVIAREVCKGFKGMELKKESKVMFSSKDLCKYDDEYDYVFSRHDSSVYITSRGQRLIGNIIKSKLYMRSNGHLYRVFLDTLVVNSFYENGRDYIVKDSRVALINRENGRLMPNSELEKGLQTALQLKEKVKLTGCPSSQNSISYQVLFSKFAKITGMSGTLKEAQKELEGIFKFPTAYIPRHRKLLRKDHVTQCFRTLEEKYCASIDKVLKLNKKGQPVLLAAGSEMEAAMLHGKLLGAGIAALLLDSDIQDREQEQKIIDNAGSVGSVTVTTNMSGRSTDIVPSSEALSVGGLFVISMQHYMNSRIDEQLKGRAGRQGQTGECRFFVSMQDRIWDYIDSSGYDKLLYGGGDSFYSAQHQARLAKAINKIQRDISHDNMVLRKRLTEFDLVMEKHREIIMGSRMRLSKLDNLEETLEYLVDFSLKYYLSKDNISEAAIFGKSIYRNEKSFNDRNSTYFNYHKEDILSDLMHKLHKFGMDISTQLYRQIVNYVFDSGYMEYRRSIEYIRNSIYLRVYNSRGVVEQFIEVASECLKEFKFDIANGIITMLMQAEVQVTVQEKSKAV